MYNKFASVYDELIRDVDYSKWVDYYFKIFKKYKKNPLLGLDLGCGTGSMTRLFAKRKIDMTGIDISPDMLMIAQEKNKDNSILYLNQDMRSFELYGTVDFIVSGLDCMNYILDKRDFLKVLKLANNYLNPGGLFIFDMNTKYKLSEILSDNTFILENENTFCSWQNEYDKRRKLCDFYLTFFNKENGAYTRFDETHTQRAYEIEEVCALIKKSGMRLLGVYDNLSFNSPKQKSERVFFVLSEQGK